MMGGVMLRAAVPGEAGYLSELALRSKGHWGYDQAFLAACREELTLRAEELAERRVTVAERNARVVGFYSLEGAPPEVELGYLFVEPAEIGRGTGRVLWEHAVVTARELGVARIVIEADPFAEAFYLAMGAVREGCVPSGSVPGRELPRLGYQVGYRVG